QLTFSSPLVAQVQQQAANKRPYKRIRMALDDPVQSCVLFDNEFHRTCFRPPLFAESALDYATRFVVDQYDTYIHYRMNWIASHWYQSHLGQGVSVILITTNKDVVADCASKTTPLTFGTQAVTVLNLPEFLQIYYPNLSGAKLLLDSLEASLQVKSAPPDQTEVLDMPLDKTDGEVVKTTIIPNAPEPGQLYPAHIPESALLAGLRSGQFLRGILRVSRFRAATEAMVALTDASAVKHQPELKQALASRSEVAVRGMQHRNRAVDGDVVVIRLLPRDQWTSVSSNISASESNAAEVVETVTGAPEPRREESSLDFISDHSVLPCGFVVGIISRNWRDYVCTLVPESDVQPGGLSEVGWVLVTPWDRRIPRIRLHTTQASKLAQERVSGIIHYGEELLRLISPYSQTKRLLTPPTPYERILNELAVYAAQRPWRVDPVEVKRRRDLRPPDASGNPASENVLIFSIDPQGCQDVDDALSVRWLDPIVHEDGTTHRRLQLGVHIADVTYFVPVGGFVDAEARRRSTSIYLADRRYDMLPGLLSGDLCSLWSGVDRYAVSVLWEIDFDNFEVLNIWYGRTVIRSSYKLTYEVAQRIYDPPETSVAGNLELLSPGERLLQKLGGIKELGELIPELKDLSKDRMLQELIKLESSIKLLVEVASTIRARRVARGGLELDSIEIAVRFADAQTRSGDLEDLVPKEQLEMHGTVAELMIFANHWVARRCLEVYPDRSCLRRHPPPRPEFFEELKLCAASRGFSLDTESNRALSASLAAAEDPKDPEVHRVLLTALGDCRSAISGQSAVKSVSSSSIIFTEADLLTPEQLSVVCRHMNEQHWAAQQVQRASMELFQALFFRHKPEDDPIRRADGIICQLRGSNGFIVLVSRFGIRGAVCVKDPQGQVAWADQQSGNIHWMPADSGFEVIRVHNPNRSDCGHLESVQTTDVQRRQKRALDEQMERDDAQDEVDQDAVIGRLHDPTSLYHQFRKLVHPYVPLCTSVDETS
ncbi:DIS3-like exonuclease 1, partial [Paragonimus westermani]